MRDDRERLRDIIAAIEQLRNIIPIHNELGGA
jgi:hypothetical protein